MSRRTARTLGALLLACALAAPLLAPATAAPPGARPAAVAAPTGDVTFSVPSRAFTGTLEVELSTPVAGTEVRYTTDGTPPTASSPVADGPVRLTRSTEVRARPYREGAPAGEASSARYVATTVTTTHDLPVLVLDSFGGGTVGDDDHPAAVLELQPQDGTTRLTDTPALATRAGYHLRGQSSRMFDKKSYRLELWDDEDDDLDQPFFGMPAESDWVLRGPFVDKSLVREALLLDLGREMGLHVPRYRFVEVYLNDDAQPVSESDYRGVYLLLETIKNQKNRLDLKKLDPLDVTPPRVEGGYIVRMEWRAAEEPLVPCSGSSRCWTDVEVHDPDDLVPEQLAYLSEYLGRVNDAIHAPDGSDPSTGYPSLIDVDSFVDMVIVNELSRDMDAYYRSQYFHKDRGGRLTAGPLWDWDLTLGVGGWFENDQVAGWQYAQVRDDPPTDWFTTLMADPAFVDRVRARWQELRRGVLSDAALRERVAALTAPLAHAADRNFRRYPNLTQGTLGPFRTPTAGTWAGQVDAMQDWLLRRAAWLDATAAWGGPVTTSSPTTSPTTPATTTPTPTATAAPTSPTPPATTPPTTTPPTTTPPTTTPAVTSPPVTSAPPATGAACTATFRTVSSWPGGFQGEVVVTAGDAPLTGWQVQLAWPAGTSVAQVWNAEVTGSGGTLTVRDVAWNGTLAPHASTTFGLIGTTSGAPETPALTCAAA